MWQSLAGNVGKQHVSPALSRPTGCHTIPYTIYPVDLRAHNTSKENHTRTGSQIQVRNRGGNRKAITVKK